MDNWHGLYLNVRGIRFYSSERNFVKVIGSGIWTSHVKFSRIIL